MSKINFGLHYNQSLSKLTTLKIGGFADYLVSVGGIGELKKAVEWIKSKSMPYAVIGKGSKVLADDNGFRGAVIILDRMTGWYFSDNGVYAQAGCSLASLTNECILNSLSGLEWASGIPATVGGAITMNAGCFGGCISDALDYADCYDGEKSIRLNREECCFSYRGSVFKNQTKLIITGAKFSLKPEPIEVLQERRKVYRQKRAATQPKGNSAGSSFKRLQNISAGELIDKSGLKGYNVGAAKISEEHANFIINTGGAKAADVEALLKLCEQTVFNKTGEKLDREILTLSEFGWKF